MSGEYRYLFINNIPLLYPKHNLARQLKVEMIFDPDSILQDLGLAEVKKDNDAWKQYIR